MKKNAVTKRIPAVSFDKKIFIIGFGAVSQCTMPILVQYLKVPMSNITVMDFEDCTELIKPWVEKGINYVRNKITPENIAGELEKYLSSGDMLIDLAWNIDCCEILTWCHENGVLYVNASTELWNPYAGADKKHPSERTLYWRHMAIRKMIAGWKKKGPTAVLEHGANPGLISHFAKKGLVDIAETMLEKKDVSGEKAEKLRQALKDREFNVLSMLTGVKVIHVSERDTQVAYIPKAVDEFVNTWSVEGFREEGIAPAELGWGTHEKEMPKFGFGHKEGPKNQICIARMGMNTWVRSWVPNYNIRGMIIRHGEAFTLSDKLTVWENGKAVYRPTVHYAYCPSDAAIASLQELRGYNYELQEKQRILRDDIISGYDILGALLMGHKYNSWWTGSILGIDEARTLVPHQNATTIQVAIGVVAAILWMIENPERGVCLPEDLDHEFVLDVAEPWLGELYSAASDWTPLKNFKNVFEKYNNRKIDAADPWQFKNFLVEEGE